MICPVCRDQVESGIGCSACGTMHHMQCWQYVGHCSVYGCSPVTSVTNPKVHIPENQFIPELNELMSDIRQQLLLSEDYRREVGQRTWGDVARDGWNACLVICQATVQMYIILVLWELASYFANSSFLKAICPF